jgi:hypothetical protein
MIRGNKRAIDLGLELAAALFPKEALSGPLLAGLIDYSRQLLALETEPFRCQDLFYIEHRALRKMQRASRAKSLSEWAEKLKGVE